MGQNKLMGPKLAHVMPNLSNCCTLLETAGVIIGIAQMVKDATRIEATPTGEYLNMLKTEMHRLWSTLAGQEQIYLNVVNHSQSHPLLSLQLHKHLHCNLDL